MSTDGIHSRSVVVVSMIAERLCRKKRCGDIEDIFGMLMAGRQTLEMMRLHMRPSHQQFEARTCWLLHTGLAFDMLRSGW
jgi:hypothetical protein